MDFRFLTPEAVNAIYDAAMSSGLVAPHLRAQLADGIPLGFFYSLPTMPDPGSQLRSDLNQLNRVEQLADGSAPLQIWLANAHTQARTMSRPEAEVFARHLDQIGRSVRGEAPGPTLALVPELKERIIVENDMLPVGFLAAGVAVGRGVARLRVPQYDGGVRTKGSTGIPLTHRGTGWLITPTLLMTNHHVVNARIAHAGPAPNADPADLARQVAEAEVLFDFDDEGQEGAAAPAAKLEVTCPDVDLDYAVVRLAATGRAPLRVRAAPVEPGRFAVNIIQHPDGGPKRVGLRNNLVTGIEPRTLRYLTDTTGGSSGSPVCDDQWNVIALHRGSQLASADYNGKTTAYVNVGTPLSAIFADLAARAPALWAEIAAAIG